MISIPQGLEPASLLWDEGLSSLAQDLLKNCCLVPPHRPLGLIAQNAEDLCATNDRNGCAVILVHLADLYRRLDGLDDALKCSQKAEQLFWWVPVERQRHNHAVALYSLGLVHHLRSSDKDALDCYDKALTEFAEARKLWVRSTNKKRWKQCKAAIHWITGLKELVTQTRSGARTARKGNVALPILGRIPAGEPLLVSEDPKDWINVDDRWADRAHFALEVEGDSMEPGISDGDLVLIRQTNERPPNGRVVAILVDGVDNEATLKRFYDEGDHFRLAPDNPDQPFIVLIPDSSLAPVVSDRYARRYPGRQVIPYEARSPSICGWAMGKIRKIPP